MKVETLARSMATMDYHAVALGHHDLSLGKEFVGQMVGWLDQPVLGTNYDLGLGESAQRRERVVEIRGVRVGVLGFLDPELAGEDMAWVEVESWEDQKERVHSIRGRCDVLIAVASVGGNQRMADLSTLYPQLDLIIGTHLGDLTPDLTKAGDKTWYTGIAGKGRYLGRIEVSFHDGGGIADIQSRFLPVEAAWGRRKPVDDLVRAYFSELRGLIASDEFLAERTSNLKEPPFEYTGTGACVECHQDQYTQWQGTAHAQAKETLVADGKEQVPECQACHSTGAGFRTGFVTPSTTPDRWQVGCETCHGPGAGHLKDTAAPYGMILAEACVDCHTDHDSPEFDYETYLPKVVH